MSIEGNAALAADGFGKGKNEALKQALLVAERFGWSVFPIASMTKDQPCVKDNLAKASNDPNQIRAWAHQYPGCNWGVSCGKSNLVGIDIDKKHGKNGFAVREKLEKAHDKIASPLMVWTPSGGLHVYSAGRCRSGADCLGDAPGIDVRSDGGYLVLPGSVTKEGVYEWEKDPTGDEVLPVFQWIIDLRNAVFERNEARDIPAVEELDLAVNVKDAIEYAKEADPAIQGQGGDQRTYDVACEIRDRGVSKEMCLEIMRDHFNPRCEPPWEDDCEKKIENAYSYAKDQIGNKAASEILAQFDDIPEDEIGAAGRDRGETIALRPFSAYDLVGDPQPRKWVIDEWLPQGEVSSLYGDGGVGKTLLAEQLAFCVAHGLGFFGVKAQPMNVFAALAEDDRHEVHRRIQNFRREYFVDPGDRGKEFQIFAYPSVDYALMKIGPNGEFVPGRFYERLKGFLAEMAAGPKLVILDTLADMFDGNENIRSQSNYFIKHVLRGLCVNYDATVLLLAHPSRAGLSSADILSGSTAWNNAVRNRLTLTNHPTLADSRIFTRKKSNYAKSGEEMLLKYDDGVFIRCDEDEELGEEVAKHADRIYGILKEAADIGNPFGNTRNFGRHVKDNLGAFAAPGEKKMKLELLNAVIDSLVADDRIKKVVGKHYGNGLYPVN